MPKIQVQSKVADYSINCASVEVQGEYMKNQNLNSSNVIKMTVNVTKVGSYSISTPSINGMKFSASGVWTTTGGQTVTLIGQGVTDTFYEFSIDIKANTSSGNASCSAHIPVMFPAMTYGVIGTETSYSWSSPERLSALNSSANFGPSGKLKIKKFGIASGWSTTTDVNTAVNLLKNKNFPDIILYNAYRVNATTEFISLLSDYVNNGGVLIYGTADSGTSAANLLLTGIFGSGYSGQASSLPSDPGKAPYPVSNLVDDPIISGPFGNAAGQYWEEDNQGSVITLSLPPNSVQIASASNIYTQPTLDPNRSIVWYNDSKNFVYFGDSVASSYDFSPYNDGWPSLYVSAQNWIPARRYAGASGRQVMCYNSILEFNSIAWGLKKAVNNGINPH